MFMVTAMIEPRSPAAYCRTENEPFGGADPGSYVDFCMFCFHVPIIGFTAGAGPCAIRTVAYKMSVKPPITTKQRFIEASLKVQLVVRLDSFENAGAFDQLYVEPTQVSRNLAICRARSDRDTHTGVRCSRASTRSTA